MTRAGFPSRRVHHGTPRRFVQDIPPSPYALADVETPAYLRPYRTSLFVIERKCLQPESPLNRWSSPWPKFVVQVVPVSHVAPCGGRGYDVTIESAVQSAATGETEGKLYQVCEHMGRILE